MSVKYTRLPTNDPEETEESAFDFKSVFTYDNNPNHNYKSVFTYDNNPNHKYKSAFTYSSPISFTSASDVHFIEYSPLIGRVCHFVVIITCFLLYVLTLPVSVWFSFKVVPNYERLVVFRLGKLVGTKGPGMVFVLPYVDRFHKVDVRIKAFNVPPKQLLTTDGAVIEVGADVYCQVSDVQKSVISVQNLDQSTRQLVQTCLVNLLVQKSLGEIEGQRAVISSTVQQASNTAANEWGIEICRVEVSQIKVLQGPQPKAPPTVMFPPGLSNMGPTQLPPAFQQLATAFMTAQGQTAPSATEQSEPQPDLLTTVVSEHSEHSEQDDRPTLSPKDILQAAQAVLSENVVHKVAASYQFEVTGPGGGLYYMDLKSGKGSSGEGRVPGEADVTLKMSSGDLQRMFSGDMKPLQAYMSGQLQASGDLAAAMRLEEVIKLIVGK